MTCLHSIADCCECTAKACPLDDVLSDEEYAEYKARLEELERRSEGAYDEYYERDESNE